jgi:dihydroxyacid dehydratase/phosphogluconate dehydratase
MAQQRMAQQRSSQWYAGEDRNAYIHRAWMRRGLPGHAFDGRPHIAIANTASDLTPCNAHLDEVAQSVKQGVWEAGGVPLNLPVVSLGESRSGRPRCSGGTWPRWPPRR